MACVGVLKIENLDGHFPALAPPRSFSVLGLSRIFDKQLGAKENSWFPDVASANGIRKITQPALRFSTLGSRTKR